MKSNLILAIDLGTSGPKVAIVTDSGKILAHHFQPTPCHLLPNGGAEQDPDTWWQAIVAASKHVLNAQGVDRKQVVAISCTAQWSGTVAVDANGNHLMNAIIWMDSRGQEYIKRITGSRVQIHGYGVDKILRWVPVTGGMPGLSGKDSIAHILFIQNEHPEIYERTYKFLEPKDFLNLKFTGDFAASFDSITLHWVTDNRKYANIRYNGELLGLAGLEVDKLPNLGQATDWLGRIRPEVAAELQLPENVRIILGTPDMQSAAIGSGAVGDFEPHLYIGTSSWLSCHIPHKKTDLLHHIASLPSAIPNRYIVANEQQVSGSCINFMRKIFLEADGPDREQDYSTLNELATRSPAGSRKVIFTPWLYGERTPVDDKLVRGGFYNIGLDTERCNFIRAVYEGVAFNSRWLLKYVEKFVKRKFDAINMIGGGAKSELWCQIHADIMNRPIRQVKEPMFANVRGAACLASVALGELSFDDVPGVVEIEHEFEPQASNRNLYDELFCEFLNIYKQNKKMFQRLNRTDRTL